LQVLTTHLRERIPTIPVAIQHLIAQLPSSGAYIRGLGRLLSF